MTSQTASPKANRLGLYGPFIALAIVAAAWSAGWLWLKGEVERQLDAAALRQAATGGVFSWSGRRVYGYPFRVDVDFTDATWREAGGWAVSAPSLKTETFVFAPGHWVGVAPAGLTLTRPRGGAVNVSGKVLRASLSDLAAHPAALSLEGLDLTFSSAPGAAPYWLQSASGFHVHTRAGPYDQGAFYVELDKAMPSPQSTIGRVAAGKPVNLTLDAIYSHASALKGPGWTAALGAWAGAGGQFEARRFRLEAGATALDAKGAGLSIGVDGRLTGELKAKLSGGSSAIAGLTAAGAIDPVAARAANVVLSAVHGLGADKVTLDFQAGRTTLGPVAIGPAPKVY